MNKQETAAILRILRSVWKETIIDQDTITAWEWAMEDVTAEQAQHAVKLWLRSGKPFFPKPVDLRELLANQAAGVDALAETAWAEVQREARRVGYQPHPTFHRGQWYEPEKPTFSSPLIAEAVDSVGWRTICQGDDSKGEIRTAFIFTFRALRERTVKQAQRGDISSGPALDAPQAAGLPREIA